MLSFNFNFSTVKVELDNVEQSRKDLREGYNIQYMYKVDTPLSTVERKNPQIVGVFFVLCTPLGINSLSVLMRFRTR